MRTYVKAARGHIKPQGVSRQDSGQETGCPQTRLYRPPAYLHHYRRLCLFEPQTYDLTVIGLFGRSELR